ncbi:uncharacterized protein LOC119744287 [Patiria miniata]|uniref:Uncharacterized protein n=1 Tax=Patiria miniata TaxID=46514 RepID=A0A914BIH2_PATMI|nr:uncharacterized protein LOC119744287 [Patiria miniata]
MEIKLIWIIVLAAVSLGQISQCGPRSMKNIVHGHESGLGLPHNKVAIVSRSAFRGGDDTKQYPLQTTRSSYKPETSDKMSSLPKKRKRKMRMIRHKRWFGSKEAVNKAVENADEIADNLLRHGHKAMREHHTRERLETAAARRTTFAVCFGIMGCCFVCTVLTVKKLCSYG